MVHCLFYFVDKLNMPLWAFWSQMLICIFFMNRVADIIHPWCLVRKYTCPLPQFVFLAPSLYTYKSHVHIPSTFPHLACHTPHQTCPPKALQRTSPLIHKMPSNWAQWLKIADLRYDRESKCPGCCMKGTSLNSSFNISHLPSHRKTLSTALCSGTCHGLAGKVVGKLLENK